MRYSRRYPVIQTGGGTNAETLTPVAQTWANPFEARGIVSATRINPYEAISRVRYPQFPSTPVLDTFTGGDENPITTNWTAPLFLNDGSLARLGNKLAGAVGGWCGAYYDAEQYGPDCFTFVTIDTLPVTPDGRVTLWLRTTSVGTTVVDGYQVYWIRNPSGNENDRIDLLRIDDGTASFLNSVHVTPLAAGAKIGIRAVGSRIEAWADRGTGWNRVIVANDTTYYTAGYFAIEINGTVARLDDFGGGTAGYLAHESLKAVANTTLTPYEDLQGISKTNGTPYEARGTVTSTYLKPYESLVPISAAKTNPYETLLRFSSALETSYENLIALAKSAENPYETSGYVTADLISPYESLLAISGSRINPYESILQLATTRELPWEARQIVVVTADYVLYWESLLKIAPTKDLSYENIIPLTKTAESSYETLQGIQLTKQSVYETLARISSTGALPYEALQAEVVIADYILAWEVLTGVSATNITPLENLQKFASTFGVAHESLSPVAWTSFTEYESLVGIQALRGIDYENSGWATSSYVLPAEALVNVSIMESLSYESIIYLALTGALSWEAIGFYFQYLRPDADLDTDQWQVAPLYPKVSDESDSTVITNTAQ